MDNTKPRCALVSAASGGLGGAILQRCLKDSGLEQVIAISSREKPNELSRYGERLNWLTTDYSEHSLYRLAETLAPFAGSINKVCICNGVLHGEAFQPEKKIEEVRAESLLEVMQANAVVPVLLLQLLLRVLKGKHQSTVAVFSARVGSIGDNGLGGWYSYRASKAALNMLLKTASIEYARRAPNVKLVAFHPGTTDTQLSKPFQAAVPKDKLFTPEFVAERLLAIMDQLEPDGMLSYLDWDNKPIKW